MSDFNDKHRIKSELSARLLLPEKHDVKTQHISQLTMEEVIAKVFPEFSKYDQKKRKNIINWRHFDKSALVIFFLLLFLYSYSKKYLEKQEEKLCMEEILMIN